MSSTATGIPASGTAAGRLAAVYAGLVYVGSLGVVGYGVLFVADTLVPRQVDRGGAHASTAAAVVIDALLLGLFAVQHSVMARRAFKRRWTRIIAPHIERTTFVAAASGVLALDFWQWRPIPTLVWNAVGTAAADVLWALFALGWAWVVAMTFAIDHFDFFGLRQVAGHLRGQGAKHPGFRLSLPYRLVRHPMMLGFFPAFLATPTMTIGHLLFALLGCGYIVAAVSLEERDLQQTHPEYAAYAARTPRLIPRLRSPRLKPR